jgi:outer membrane protein OmpA-like peptidoglycan-associated protein
VVQRADNVVVVFDKSASMGNLHGKPMVDEATRLMHAKNAVKNMTAAIPDIKLNTGLRTFWGEETAMIYGMGPLVKEDYTKAVNSIEFPNGRSPLAGAITAAGKDIRGAGGNSAIIIVSDFSEIPGIDDIRPAMVMESISKVNAEYGGKLCVYAVQVGYTPDGKELSEQIVQNVEGGYAINADKLVNPAAMAAFVERVITSDCLPYKKLAEKPVEKVVIVAAEPRVEEKVVAAVVEPKREEKAVVVAAAEPKVIILAFEDVHFDFDKSTLTPEARTILKRNIQLLKDNPKSKVRIAGYTSASGTEAYNMKLGERRANAVQKYLLDEGIITQERFSTISYGEANPMMYEAAPKELYSKAAHANMRVLFEIIVQ